MDRPIIFSAPMVLALLEGRKTQTRRIVKPQPDVSIESFLPADPSGFWGFSGNDPVKCIHSRHGERGDRLWVRETWSHDAESLEQCRSAHEDVMGSGAYGPYYKATEVSPDTLRWRSPMFMPRWASRITLEITGVRVERLQEISGDDAFAEGVQIPCCAESGSPLLRLTGKVGPSAISDKHPRDWRADDYARLEYAELFETINGNGSWASNPWVWVIEFKRVN